MRHTGTAVCAQVPEGRAEELTPDLLPEGGRDASILVVRDLFDTGAPETALARVMALGIQAIVGPGFESEFYPKCFEQGVLPVIVDEGAIEALADWVVAHPGESVTVDLEEQVIERPGMDPLAFGVDPRLRNKLLLGLTDLEEMLRYMGNAKTLRSVDRNRRPWLYEDT